MPALDPASTGEFGLIARHFVRHHPLHHTALGVGDDCALLAPHAGQQIAISTDMLVAGRHFFEDADPAHLGHKALAVNLSDLAACGARPLAFTLALALPAADEAWLARFASGLFALADAQQCDLMGGDTTRGPLNVCITIFGSVPPGQALLRSGAKAGDDIYVSHAGTRGGLGDARLALHLLQLERGIPLAPDDAAWLASITPRNPQSLLPSLRHRLDTPTARMALGRHLRGIASACADISDGLAGDLGHILDASGTGATLWTQHTDGSGLLAATSPALRTLGDEAATHYALAGGDDYELVFTAPATQRAAVQQAAAQAQTSVCRVGRMDAAPGLRWQDRHGHVQALASHAFDHFG